MSLSLNCGTFPEGLEIKTWGHLCSDFDKVYLGEYEITFKDFFEAAYYVLTNTDLEEDDPRINFVRRVRELKNVKGFGPAKIRMMG